MYPPSRRLSGRAAPTPSFLVPLALTFALGTAALPVMAAPPAALWSKPGGEVKKALAPAAKGKGAAALDARRALALVAFYEEEFAISLAHWAAVFGAAPGSWEASAYWEDFASGAAGTGRDDLLIASARRLLAAKDAPLELRACARESLAAALFRAGKNAEADALWAAPGWVRKWKVVGPFDNVSRSGFDAAYSPESAGVDYAAGAPDGADGMALRWHEAAQVTRSGEVGLASTLGRGRDENVFYAATAVRSGKGGAAVLHLDVSGAAKVFLNGEPVLRDPIYRSTSPDFADALSVPVTLKAGWNTVLVKVADDEDSNASFRLRFSGAPGLSTAPDPARVALRVPAGTGEPRRVASSPLVDRLSAHLAASPDDLEAARALGVLLRDRGDYEGSASVLRAAAGKAPKSAILQWELSRTLGEDGQGDEADAARGRAIALDKRLLAARADQIKSESDALSAAEQVERYKELLAVNPNCYSAVWGLVEAYREAEMKDESLRAVRRAHALSPNADSYDSLFQWLKYFDRGAEAEKALAAGIARYPNDRTLLYQRLRGAAAQGRTGEAIASGLRLLAVERPDPAARRELAKLFQAAGQRAKALEHLAAARRERPQDATICAELAEVQRAAGRKAEAVALYKEAVRLDPAAVGLRDRLLLLSGGKPVASLAPPTPVEPLLKNLPTSKSHPGASEVRVLDEGRVVLHPDHARALYVREVITVLDGAAVEKYQQLPFALPSGTARPTLEVARIIKPGGKVMDCRDKAEYYYAAFPSLAPGDTIDLSYRVEDCPRGGLAGKFWDDWAFSQPSGPVKLSRYAIVAPKDMALEVRAHGGAPEPTVRAAGAWTVREWRVADLPAAKQEVLAPAESDGGMWVDVSTVRSWKEIVDWYAAVSGPRCVPDSVVRAKAEELTRGLTAEADKIRAIVGYVSGGIRYQTTPFRLSAYTPTEGKEVLRDTYGDCKDKAALLTAMLSHVGIKSRMALVSPRSNGTTPYLPGPRFSHAIAVVETADGPLWVDATADSIEFGGLPSEDQGIPALIIDPKTTDLVTIPPLPPARSGMSETVVASLTPDGALKAKLDLSGTGNIGWMLRSSLRRIPESSHEQMMKALLSRLVENGRLTSSKVGGLEKPDDPLALSFEYEASGFAQQAGDFLLARVPWAAGAGITSGGGSLTDYLRSDVGTRRRDVEISYSAGRQFSRVSVTLPTGYTVKDLKPEVKGESLFGSYRFAYTLNGDTLTAEREVIQTPLRVPAKDLAEYVKFLESIDKQTKAPLLLTKQ